MQWKNIATTFLAVLLFTSISLFSINQYRYGISDQTITIPYVKSFLNPALYPGDYVLGQKIYYYTYFWDFCGLLIRFTHLSIPVFFFLCYAACIFFSFLALWRIAMTLFQNRAAAFLSLFFLLFSHRTFAGSSTFEHLLLTKVAALPLLLFVIYFSIREKHIAACMLAGIAFLVHPMSAVYVAAMIFFSLLLSVRKTGIKQLLTTAGIFLFVASPMLARKLLHTPPSQHFFQAGAQWLELLHLRSAHHIFPFTWDSSIFVQAILIALLFFISTRHKAEAGHHRIITHFVMAILLLCITGTVFAEIFPLAIVINLQLLRSFTFFWYIAMIYSAHYFITEMKSEKSFLRKAIIVIISAGIFYGAPGWKYPFAALLIIFLCLMIYESRTKNRIDIEKYFIAAVTAAVVLIGTGIYSGKNNFSIGVAAPSHWLDVQRWAKQNTGINDVFIVPPQSGGFRIESERTIYGDWKDGTLMNFNPAFGEEWFRRMKNLGYEKTGTSGNEFRQLGEDDMFKIVREIKEAGEYKSGKIFFVSNISDKTFAFPVVYKNDDYVIYVVA